MAVVLLKIFEEANLSGELRLSGRKLRDFPKAAGKYNLSDTVIADLSRNRFAELPEDVTGFPFLETLIMYNNTIRTIPDTIRGLYSLTFLDLRSNLLSVLPREICFLPLHVLLVSNNRLVSLPDELGRMERLTELDAACNQITHLPARLSDLKSLRSLSLRNNHLVYLPRDLCHLHLITLDVSCNRIASLPVELRLMTELVSLELQSNPLTSPPASLCVRGLVHVFKYLDTMAMKEEKSRSGGTFDGHTTLRRNQTAKVSTRIIDSPKLRQQLADSGYSTSDGLDKRLWHDVPPTTTNSSTPDVETSPTSSAHNRTLTMDNVSPSTPNSSHSNSYTQDQFDSAVGNSQTRSNGANNNTSTDVSPDGDNTPESQKSGDRLKSILGNVQTYREYKEALRQQRNQDSNAIYRPKEQQSTSSDGSSPTLDSPTSTFTNFTKSIAQSATMINNSSPVSTHQTQMQYQTANHTNGGASAGSGGGNNGSNGGGLTDINVVSNKTFINSIELNNGIAGIMSPNKNDKPVQKVIPSRNTTPIKYHQTNNSNSIASPTTMSSSSSSSSNGNNQSIGEITAIVTKETSTYVKPNSPAVGAAITSSLAYNNVPSVDKTAKVTTNKNGTKPIRNVSWNRDIPPEKLSFTMRRELDRHKEEKELIEQLRTIIESRLKMSLPKDLASALTDGVVLCHLANYIRPRSVATIHVPSPAVPKLTMARCRRNVDNFLDACRKIGVDEELICSCADIMPCDEPPSSHQTTNNSAPMTSTQFAESSIQPSNPNAMYKTLAVIIDIIDNMGKIGPSNGSGGGDSNGASNTSCDGTGNASSPSTNTKTYTATTTAEEIENYNNYFKSVGIHFQKIATRNDTLPYKCTPNGNTAIVEVTNNDGPTVQYDNQSKQQSIGKMHGDDDSQDKNRKRQYNSDKIVSATAATTTNSRIIPKTLDLYSSNDASTRGNNNSISNASKKRKLLNTRYNFNQMLNEKYYNQFQLNEIVEECGYDSDIGKFNCKPGDESSLASDSSSSVDLQEKLNCFVDDDQAVINNLDSPKKQTIDALKKDYKEKFNIKIDTGLSNVTKDYTNDPNDHDDSGIGDEKFLNDKELSDCNQSDYSSILCLTAFFTSAVWLYFFPLPS